MASYNPSLRGAPTHGYKNGLESLVTHNRGRKLGHWSSCITYDGLGRRWLTVWHYSHRMLAVLLDDNGEPIVNPATVEISLGWGSVSDQGGMNRLFRALRLPLYYSRKDGAEISSYDDGWNAWLYGDGTNGC